MTEEEKRAKAFQIQQEYLATSRAASLFSGNQAATQAALAHSLEVERTYEGMAQRGFTVDDLIEAYNRGSQQSFDFAVSFFFAAYAIALHEQGRDVMEALNAAPVPGDSHSFPISSEEIDELKRRGITKRDLQRMERRGAKNTKKEMGVETLINSLAGVEDEDMIDRIREIMDEEISTADIMDRCLRETGIDIGAVLEI